MTNATQTYSRTCVLCEAAIAAQQNGGNCQKCDFPYASKDWYNASQYAQPYANGRY